MSLYDRITGKKQKKTCTDNIFGRWQVLSDSSTTLLNAFQVHPGDYLVPDGNTFKWKVHDTLINQSLEGDFIESEIPSRKSLTNIRSSIAKYNKPYIVAKYIRAENGSEQDLEVDHPIPFDLEIVELSKLNDLDKKIIEYIGYLERICYRPAAYLRTEVEKVPISRARRISPRAVIHLTSHTEDWENRRVSSVTPKRILSEIREDQIDIYENRVVYRLVDEIDQYLEYRCNQVELLENKLNKIKERMLLVSSGSHWRTNRIFELLGRAFANDISPDARDTLNELENLHRRIKSLFGSPLYQSISPRVTISASLKHTNLLINDQYYRKIVILWDMLNKESQKSKITGKQMFQEYQDLCNGFDGFCVLLFVFALESLNMLTEKDDFKLERGGPECHFYGVLGELWIKWLPDGTIDVHTDNEGKAGLRCIPIASHLVNNTELFVANRMDKLSEQVLEIDKVIRSKRKHVIFYLTSDEKENFSTEFMRRINAFGPDLASDYSGNLSFIPVAPLDFESVERTARLLRWILSEKRLLNYPPIINFPVHYQESIFEVCGDWLKPAKNSEIKVVKAVSLDSEQMKQLYKVIERIKRTLRSSPKANERDHQLKAIADFENNIHEELIKLINLGTCPQCREPANWSYQFEFDDNDCFRFSCSECRATWGVSSCSCKKRYPYLFPYLNFAEYEGKLDIDKVEMLFGEDLLAVPKEIQNGKLIFECPYCHS